jgi:hypothetical protein
MRSLMGDYAYAPVAQANPLLGPLLYWSWQILCQVIFLNLIIAAFCEDFAKILMLDKASKEKTMFDVVGEFDMFKRAQVPPPSCAMMSHAPTSCCDCAGIDGQAGRATGARGQAGLFRCR